MKHGKKYVDSAKLIDSLTAYDPADAVALVCQTAKAKFDETIEISARLGVDPRHADQQVRGAVVPRKRKPPVRISWALRKWFRRSRPKTGLALMCSLPPLT